MKFTVRSQSVTQRLFISFIISLTASGAAFVSHVCVAEDVETIAKVLDYMKKWRVVEIDKVEDAIKANEGEQKEAAKDKTKVGTAKRNELKMEALRLRGYLANLKKNPKPAIPKMETLSVGGVGYLAYSVRVSSVVDGDEFIGEFGRDTGVWIKGFNTSGLVDDQRVNFNQIMTVSETTDYKTVLGAKRTVFVLETFDVEKATTKIDKQLKERGLEAPK